MASGRLCSFAGKILRQKGLWAVAGGNVGIVAGAEGGVAGAEEDEIAVEGAVGVDVAAGYDVGGPGEDVDGQKSKGGGGGGELDVGGGVKRRPSFKP
jgi:hypothetical protein